MSSWWDEKVNTIEQFRGWVRGVDDPSRKYVRDYIISKKYKNVLDVAAGLCEDYDGLQRDAKSISYVAVDFTDKFVAYNKNRGVEIIKSNCDNLPFLDIFFDMVYCRHLIEHLPYYETTLSEMIRCAHKEVVVTFFLPTIDEKEDNIRVVDNLNHNFYSKSKMEKFLKKNRRVQSLRWEKFGVDEEILFIELK